MVCKNHPEFCEDLNKDSWCKDLRAEVIMGRYYESIEATDDIRYNLILSLESYSECVELASHIEHIKLKSKKTSRVNGYLASIENIKILSEKTINSNYPFLLYWHWSRNGNELSLNKFLDLQEQKQLETPELQLKLATYYSKFDRDKTIDILYHALELYNENDKINPEIMVSLSTLFLKEEKVIHAYVWGKMAKKYGVDLIDLAPLKALLTNKGVPISKLNDLSERYQENIEAGEFEPPSR